MERIRNALAAIRRRYQIAEREPIVGMKSADVSLEKLNHADYSFYVRIEIFDDACYPCQKPKTCSGFIITSQYVSMKCFSY